MAAVSGRVNLRPCVPALLPGMIEHIAKIASTIDDTNKSEGQAACVTEIWKALSALLPSVPDEQRALCVYTLSYTDINLSYQQVASCLECSCLQWFCS